MTFVVYDAAGRIATTFAYGDRGISEGGCKEEKSNTGTATAPTADAAICDFVNVVPPQFK